MTKKELDANAPGGVPVIVGDADTHAVNRALGSAKGNKGDMPSRAQSDHIVKKVFRDILIVQVLTMLIGVIGMVVDGAVTGSLLSVDHMAAYGLVMPMLTIFSAIATICEVGTSTLLGRILGSGKTSEAGQVLSTCLITAFLMSLIAGVATCAGRPFIVGLLGAQSDTFIFEEACNFLFGFSFIAPGMFVLMTLFPVMQLNGDSKRLVAAIVVMTVVNIVLDVANGLVFKQGLLGMALATTISYYAALAVLIPHFFRKNNLIVFGFKNLNIRYAGEMALFGLPNTIQQVCRSLLVICINHLLLQLAGPDSVAVYSAVMSAANLCMVLGSALGTTGLIVGSVFDGEKDLHSLKRLMRLCFIYAIVLDVALTVIAIAAAGLFMPFFLSTAEAETLVLLVHAFRLYALSITFYAVNCVLRMYFLVIRKIGMSYLFAALNNFLFPCIGAFGLSALIGLDGVWLSYLFGESATLLMYAIYVLVATRKDATWFERILLIPADYRAGVIAEFNANASTQEEALAITDEIRQFCQERNASTRILRAVTLIAEELLTNTVHHSFDDGKSHSVDVKLIEQRNEWILRLRDDGKSFNPIEYLAQQEDNEDFDSAGIRIAYKLSSNMEYLNTLSLNNLIVTIS